MPELLSLGELARELGVKPSLLSALLYNGDLPRERTHRIGGRTVFDRAFIEAVVKPTLRRKGYIIREVAVA